MSVRPIIEVPDPLLKTISTPVEAVTDETRALMDDMVETMYDAMVSAWRRFRSALANVLW